MELFTNKKSSFSEEIISPIDVRSELWSYYKFVMFKLNQEMFSFKEINEIFRNKLVHEKRIYNLMKIFIFPEIKKRFFKKEIKNKKVSKYILCFYALVKVIVNHIKFDKKGNKIKSSKSRIMID